jgi:hypothetical protein
LRGKRDHEREKKRGMKEEEKRKAGITLLEGA